MKSDLRKADEEEKWRSSVVVSTPPSGFDPRSVLY